MAALKLRKFSNVEEAGFFLAGGILSGGKTVGRVYGLVGLTLTFTTPSVVVTFTAGADPGGSLSFAEIKSQIETASALLLVRSFGPDGTIGIIEATPTNGVVLKNDDEAAKVLLGFQNSTTITGAVYKAPTTNTAPCLVNMYSDVQSNAHVVVTWE